VLIVDDHSAIREGLKSALRDSGEFKVIGEAADAAQALGLVEKIRPAIVVLDVSIPGLSGIKLAEQIRGISHVTRVVVYTMHAELGFQAAMMRAGAAAYVLKGEPLSTLLDALRMTRDGRTSFFGLSTPTVANEAELEGSLRKLSQRDSTWD